jgi:hypothetical protein
MASIRKSFFGGLDDTTRVYNDSDASDGTEERARPGRKAH